MLEPLISTGAPSRARLVGLGYGNSPCTLKPPGECHMNPTLALVFRSGNRSHLERSLPEGLFTRGEVRFLGGRANCLNG